MKLRKKNLQCVLDHAYETSSSRAIIIIMHGVMLETTCVYIYMEMRKHKIIQYIYEQN